MLYDIRMTGHVKIPLTILTRTTFEICSYNKSKFINVIWCYYNNTLLIFNCSKHVFEVPMAFCMSQERTSGGEACPNDCSGFKEKLVCGSDESLYRNDCEMKMLNCG